MDDNRLLREVFERAQTDNNLGDDAAVLVLSACHGPDDLAAILGGNAARTPEPTPAAPELEPAGAYLDSITVEGFRGIGPSATLELTPGPGLTLVMGRNGSGKSSFAEGLEVLLTGDNWRWAHRSVVWKEGWRNLHHQGPVNLQATFLVDGRAGSTVVERSWPAPADFDDSSFFAQPQGEPRGDLSRLGWSGPLDTFRPFLSHNELESMLDDGPSALFDALSSILGLEVLTGATEALRQARLGGEKALKNAKKELKDRLLPALGDIDDERATACREALGGRTWDLDRVEEVVAGSGGGVAAGSEMEILRSLSAMEGPAEEHLENLAGELRAAGAALQAVAGTDAGRARQVARLLAGALDLHAAHGDGDCPVCGRDGALTPHWEEQARQQLALLTEEAAAAEAAESAVGEARRKVSRLIGPLPEVVGRSDEVGLDTADLMKAWEKWGSISALTDLQDQADQLEKVGRQLGALVSLLNNSANVEIEKREDTWRPVALLLSAWLVDAREAERRAEAVPDLKEAETWLKKTTEEMRNERFEPIADRSREIWSRLRQQSHVELGRIELEGSGTRRRVSLDVTVDEVEGAALAVMSQGELNALALSLFLPRATLPDSPFRFVVIDDPVQAMDPARVDGLAQALEEVARDRQVVVFTHDDRLASSVRRLSIPARILEVARREDSVVELRQSLDPVDRYLEDARALALTPELAPEIAQRVVPGFCRSALEAVASELVWRRRLARGERHADTEELLAAQARLTGFVSLALFDDPDRGGEVLTKLNTWGRWAGDVYQHVNRGAHGDYAGGLGELIHETQRLCERIRGLT